MITMIVVQDSAAEVFVLECLVRLLNSVSGDLLTSWAFCVNFCLPSFLSFFLRLFYFLIPPPIPPPPNSLCCEDNQQTQKKARSLTC